MKSLDVSARSSAAQVPDVSGKALRGRLKHAAGVFPFWAPLPVGLVTSGMLRTKIGRSA